MRDEEFITPAEETVVGISYLFTYFHIEIRKYKKIFFQINFQELQAAFSKKIL